MKADRSDWVYEQWLGGAQRLDYFVVGMSIALVGYLTPNVKLVRVGAAGSWLEVAAIVMLLAATVAGLKRIEATLTGLKATHLKLSHGEAAGALMAIVGGREPKLNERTGKVVSPDEALLEVEKEKQLAQAAGQSESKWYRTAAGWYRVRNALFVGGLVSLLIGRILTSYGL